MADKAGLIRHYGVGFISGPRAVRNVKVAGLEAKDPIFRRWCFDRSDRRRWGEPFASANVVSIINNNNK